MRTKSLITLALLFAVDAWKLHQRTWRKAVAFTLTLATFGLGTPLQSKAEDGGTNNIADQIKLVQAMQVENQRARLQTMDQEAMAKELQMKDGQLIARGTVTLLSDALNAKTNPMGYPDAMTLDGAYSDPASTMFVLCVGREGSVPLAAKAYPLNELKFPMVFEVESSDLLFPYTPEAWLASTNRADTIAVSVFITPDSVINRPNEHVRVGFALSDPVTIAGVLTRATAAVQIQTKLDSKLYTPEETALLTSVDNGLSSNKLANAKK